MMHLVPKQQPAVTAAAIELPLSEASALRAAYAGSGTQDDVSRAIRLVQKARTFNNWIACDCIKVGHQRPLLAPAYLTFSETYYVKRLTGPDRLEHHILCPFHFERPEASLKPFSKPGAKPLDIPTGLFAVLPAAGDAHFAEGATENEEKFDRTSYARRPPRLARQLWRLLSDARRNIIPAIGTVGKPDMKTEFEALQAAAARLDVAPGIALKDVLITHPLSYHSGALFAKIRKHDKTWPQINQPQGYLIAYCPDIAGKEMRFKDIEPIVIAGSLQAPIVADSSLRAPYLAIAAIGKHPEAHGYAALRGYAQPILAGNRFVPIDSHFERLVLKLLIDVQWVCFRLNREIAITLKKPLFDIETPKGPCRPDFIADIYHRKYHSRGRLVIEAMGYNTPEYHIAKSITHPRMAELGAIYTVSPDELVELQKNPQPLVDKLLSIV